MERFPSIVADIMSSPAITVDGETSVRDAAQIMAENGIGSVIVREQGEAVGIITKMDMVRRVVSPCRDPREAKAREIMSSPLITVQKETGILAAMKMMKRHGITQLAVMDGEELVGIVSERDVVRAVSIASLTHFSPLLRERES